MRKGLREKGPLLLSWAHNNRPLASPALSAAAKTGPEAAEWLMRGIARYGDTVTELLGGAEKHADETATDVLRGAAKHADDATQWGLLVSALEKAENSGDLLKSAVKSADETLDTAQSAAISTDELVKGAGNYFSLVEKSRFDSLDLFGKNSPLTDPHAKSSANTGAAAISRNNIYARAGVFRNPGCIIIRFSAHSSLRALTSAFHAMHYTNRRRTL